MDKSIIKENILRQLDLIVEQNQNLNANKGKIPQIEIDIIKDSIKKLYEQICGLEKVVKNVEISQTVNINDKTAEIIAEIIETPENPLVITEEIIEQLKIQEVPVVEDIQVIAEEENLVIEAEEHVEVIFTPEPKAIIEEKVIEINENTVKETIKNTEEKNKVNRNIDLFGSANTTIADKYRNEKKSINERISRNRNEKSLGARMQQNQIKDLKSAIGINEKFLFINELFKGNMKAYNDSILSLNNCESYDAACDILNSLKDNYKWEDDMVAYLTLKDFVDRKHFR